ADAAAHGFFHGSQHARVGVTKDQRAPRADVIEVLIAVDVVKIWTLASGDEQRLAAHGAERPRGTIDSARDQPAGPFKRFLTANADWFHTNASVRLREAAAYFVEVSCSSVAWALATSAFSLSS